MLTNCKIKNFRNITSLSQSFTTGLNNVIGDNGSGKTSLLEALFTAGNAKSFRTNQIKECIKKEQDSFQLNISNSNGIEQAIEVSRSHRSIYIDQQKPERLSQFLNINTILAITPEDQDLVSSNSQQRRKFIDRGVFEEDQNYLSYIAYYQRIVKNRNALLRQSTHHDLPYWNHLLCEYSQKIHEYRSDYINRLQELIKLITLEIGYPHKVKITYLPAKQGEYRNKKTMLTALEEKYNDEVRYGYTLLGIHRDNIQLTLNNLPVSKYASFGQKKTVAVILKLAQAQLMCEKKREPVLLIDDLAAGLDIVTQEKLLSILKQYTQVIMSALPGEYNNTDFTNTFYLS
ncbi:DNA replication/repair protein RecF [Desulfurispira natronophila]|uniref:DNA replication and repair protein RecF n=1 Tax=Desulfurispira natronophila TaxID=682562 RepID=A0A7W7Y3Y2_9BACT|nr:DNA replication and repair protein RecF [Desulfurispira natronophila]MBB5021489.1 DNA replication and repair protein RecF [Desulfurispira natronophila]